MDIIQQTNRFASRPGKTDEIITKLAHKQPGDWHQSGRRLLARNNKYFVW